ncbi:type IX secretion system sortase PorU [Aquimarina sp. ERC-38]|uniref:type IX secretion system sortase PorU n=1 Tax=Aquimarina sp. ERC-38 TaxID=2949996 RepID=UPI0022463B50|nr:type IX secretion system sortase PorU [Aquimarina sp. ERC-38]UZO82436.1 type IX secretion system sortase PorU [Aquimarina sp. ERC-38]
MMKKILLLLILGHFAQAFGQTTKKIAITWKEIFYETTTANFKFPAFDRQFLEYQDPGVIYYVNQWKTPGSIDANTAKISNVSFEPISKEQLKNLTISDIPEQIDFKVSSINFNGSPGIHLKLKPFVRKGSQYQKITSFDLSYANGVSTKNFRRKMGLTSSVLANGDWFKFQVGETGVYKISASFLESMGIDLSNVNPNTLKIYGNGGAMLPLRNMDNTQFGLRENAIQIIGGEDGILSGDDHILFYGEGTMGFNQENMTHLNLYDDRSFYYITYGGNPGKRIAAYVEPTGAATTQINQFTENQFVEKDEVNLGSLGRRWFGDNFDIENTKNYSFNFPNLVTSEPVEISVQAAASAESSTSMDINVNGTNLQTITFGTTGSLTVASGSGTTSTFNASSDNINVQLTYNNGQNPRAQGYLDYISITATRALRGTGSQFQFSNQDNALQTGIAAYQITNASSITQVWDVSNPTNITRLTNTSGTLTFKSRLGDQNKKFVALTATDFLDPIQDSEPKVDNQNIKGTIFLNQQQQFQDVDYLIIARKEYLSSANRLAEHHRSRNGFNVKILTLADIYTEFSSGKQDIVAIRNVIKYVYDNASEESKRLKYLALLGDASVDYKDRLPDNTNVVPIFHSLRSFSTLSSFASDDFFGFMDPEEGLVQGSDKLDIAVGRILAGSPQQAERMVDKIVNYNSKPSFGRWRNSILLVADDVDVDWEEAIQLNLNDLGDRLFESKPFFNIEKVYADAFRQQSSSSGFRYPKVTEAINTNIEKGALLINYFGHGGEDGLAKEFIYTKSDVQNLTNQNRYPLFITVTCEYTKFDNPLRATAGELLYNNPEGGAISLITTTRSIDVRTGIRFNNQITEFLFPEGDNYPSVAEAVRLTKNESSSNDIRVVFYIGDPALKLAIPEPNVRLTQINGTPIGNDTIPLQALGRVKIAGEVVSNTGQVLTDYNGVLSSAIYDKNIERNTLANDNTRDSGGEIIKLDFTTLGEIIFRGKASVTSGQFEFDFVVPKDINISEGNGRISFYAEEAEVAQDRTGASNNIVIGGINENAPEDNQGPEIQLFMNDENFVSGGVTDRSPILIGKLQDENGINTASGIGHDLSAILDDDESNPIILNDFYETELDDFTRGVVNFKLRNLEPGLHTLRLKGWDVYNNAGTQEIQFIVAEDSGLALDNVLNYPNPFISNTQFWFEHSSSISDVLEVQVQVFTVSGKVVWTTNQTLSGKTSYKEEIQWDGRDDFGDRIGKGVYVYKISVKSTLTNERVEEFEKLVIL